MSYLRIADDTEATGPLAEVYAAWRKANPERTAIPEILRCFSFRPDFLRQVMDFSYGLHFSPGHLDRRHKEMIATFVSGLNHCPY